MNKIKKIIIIITVIAFVLTAAFFGTLFWMKSKGEANVETEKQKTAPIVSVSHQLTDPIIVNIKESTKLLRAKAIVEIKNDSEEDHILIAELEEGDGVLKPPFVTVLRNKSLDEIIQPDSHEKFSAEIVEALNHEFKTESFLDVEFSEFIYQ